MNMNEATPALAFVDIHKSFASESVLRGVFLRVARGGVHCIVGRSGAGKSVLVRLAVGLLRADQGRIWVDGRDITALSETQLEEVRIGCQLIFQGSALFDQWRVLDNLMVPLRKRLRLPRAQAAARAHAALCAVQAERYAAAWPDRLGAGLRKRIAIARALALRPRILILDEPTCDLDPVAARCIDRLIRQMASHDGITALVVTHDLVSVARIADRVSFLHEGQIGFEGDAGSLLSTPDPIVRRFVGAAPMALASAVRLPCRA